MRDGFLKVACASPEQRVADCGFNTEQLLREIDRAASRGVALLVLPELAVTSYSCEDLFLQNALLESASRGVTRLAAATEGKNLVAVVGFPLTVNGKLYNAAAVLSGGRVLGVVPKSYLPNYTEFYEGRRFAAPPDQNVEIELDGQPCLFGTKQLFCCRSMPLFVLGVEICEDLFVAIPPSSRHSLAGATVIANPSASDELVCKPAFRRQLVAAQSAKNAGGYVYSNAGPSESTSDVVFSAHSLIAENGALLAESKPFGPGYCETELDLERLVNDRRRTTSVRDDAPGGYARVAFDLALRETALSRKIPPRPFIPSDKAERDARCEDILDIQSYGLKKRMEHARSKTAVLGVSGGLDSTLALLVCARTLERMGRPATDIEAVSMPCFGTTARTRSNAEILCERLGVSFRVVDITASVKQHLADIGHDGATPDVTLENAQARERTQVLMDLSNLTNGLVIGTGDLSEQALGWCTYNGDHMSMYAVNTSVPKTLVRHLVRYAADKSGDEALRAVLYDILDTPVSPELLPSDGEEMVQKTEDLIGPYELHDFFLYYFVRWCFSPRKIFRLAQAAFAGEYDDATVKKWLREFCRRFFIHQFKRTCVPNGPKIGSVSLSPRGDWRMPSDASSALWLKELDEL